MAGHPLINKSTAVFAHVAFTPTGRVEAREFERVTDLAKTLCEELNIPFLDLSPDTDGKTFCVKSASETIASASRRSLIVCGGLLEGAVTQVSIAALLDGYDVFVVDDFCISEQDDNRQLFINRIKDCGASFVTARQVVHDVSAQHADEYSVSTLRRTLEQFPL